MARQRTALERLAQDRADFAGDCQHVIATTGLAAGARLYKQVFRDSFLSDLIIGELAPEITGLIKPDLPCTERARAGRQFFSIVGEGPDQLLALQTQPRIDGLCRSHLRLIAGRRLPFA